VLLCSGGGTVNNCTIIGNSASTAGGGVFFSSGGTLNNCTISGNSAPSGSGGGVYSSDGGTLNNCIVNFNTPGGTGNLKTNAGFTAQYTCSPGLAGSGNITNDPQFVNASAGNYRLSAGSPCINAGTNQAWMTGRTDLDGNPRIIAGTVDMGAYECVVPPGNALSFNGTNAYVQIPDASSLELTNNYTLEAWINADTFRWLGGIIGKYQVASANGYVLRLGGTAPYNGIGFDNMETGTNLLQSNCWYHVAAVNSNGTRHLYLNGVDQVLTGTPLTVQANTNVLSIGADYLASPRYFDGRIDEVRIWSVARTLDQIRDAMHQQLTGGEAGLVAYYNFNVSSGTLLSDRTTNGNDGTLVNGPIWTNSTFPCANLIVDRTNLRGAWIAQTNSLASSILSVSNSAVTVVGYRVFGHDGGALTNDTPDKPVAFAWRLNRAWQVEGTGSLTGTLSFDCTSITNLIQNTARMRLLVDTDGIFSNASAATGAYAANAFKASAQSLPQSGYYTIGEYDTRTITATAGPNGAINPSNAIIMTYGDSTNFVITPATYWHVGDVTTNGASVGTVTAFTWSNIVADGTINSTFAADLAAQGTPHWWLAQYGLTNGGWTFNQAETNRSDSDPFANWEEYICDTDPTNLASFFNITAVSNLPPRKVYFLSSTVRMYTLNGITNLVSGVWTNVPGAGPRLGVGGADTMQDTNVPSKGPFYRLGVQLP
jgi:hypothetical protein